MKLIKEVYENLEYIAEANADGEKEFFIEGIFMQANQKNRNGRMYPTDILEKEVERYNQEYVEKNRAFGELGHPQGPTINLERVSHMIKSLTKEGDNFIGKAKIMDSPYGNIVKNLIKEGASLGVSSRGMGSLKSKNGVNEVQGDFYLATAADIVADPSAPDAFVEGIMEGVEWVYEGGKWVEHFVEQAQQEVHAASKADLEQIKLQVFENFLKRL
jgi:hypothetical protein|tara:strand:- start:1776 stop:2423 length:648 start_codon:yes stop_codon:yes gene_type:complete